MVVFDLRGVISVEEGNDPRPVSEEHITPHTPLNTGHLETLEALVRDTNSLLEANLETSVRIYDALITLITAVTGSRHMSDGLRQQHHEGITYHPPYAVTNSDRFVFEKPEEDDET